MKTATINSTLRVFIMLLLAGWASATSYYFPKFGTPILAGERLVFAGPGWEPHRIICIDRKTGGKLWEIGDKSKVTAPWLTMDDHLIVQLGSELHHCALDSGHTKRLYRTGYERCHLADKGSDCLLVQGEKSDVDYLACVNSSTWKQTWETPRLTSVLAKGDQVLLCNEETRKRLDKDTYTFIDRGIVAVSKTNGKILWRKPYGQNVWFAHAVAISNYFLVSLEGSIKCWDQANGTLVNELRIRDKPYASTSLAVRDGHLLVWTQRGEDVFSGHVVYTLSVPDLKKRELTETDWYAAHAVAYEDIVIGQTIGRIDVYHAPTGKKLWQGGQWNWNGIHDGYIYFSDMEPDGKHTTVNRIHVKTGKRDKLYEEMLPSDQQWKR